MSILGEYTDGLWWITYLNSWAQVGIASSMELSIAHKQRELAVLQYKLAELRKQHIRRGPKPKKKEGT